MDPLTGAVTFATIVSLIGQYRSERGARSKVEFDDFLTWLLEKQHQEIKKLLESNQRAASSIKSLLEIGFDSLMERIDSLDSALATFASHTPEFGELSAQIRPESRLSEQALSILRQFESSGAGKVVEAKSYDGISLLYLDGDLNGGMQIEDERFLEDDLNRLIDLGLLRNRLNSSGNNVYIYTRAASEYVQELNS